MSGQAWTLICCAMLFSASVGMATAQEASISRSATDRVHLRDTWPLSDTVIADPVPLSPAECEKLGGTIKAHASCEKMGTKCVVKTADGKEHHVCITEAKSD
jgi:hypothetical protein